MKKLILPVLFGITTLFLSGKPAPQKGCGPRFIIDNLSGFLLPILSVYVRNLTTGSVATYQNPTFPIYHVDTGGDFSVSVYFDHKVHAAILVYSPCHVANVHAQTGIDVYFPAFSCDEYTVLLHATDSHTNAYCP